VLVAAMLLLAAAGVAQAQDEEPVEYRWGLKAGFFYPTNNNLRDQASDFWWRVGVDYYPHFRFRPLNGDVFFGIDFAWRDHGGKGFFTIPLTVKIAWPITSPESRLRVYGGGGLGVCSINTAFIGATTQPVGQFFLGVDINERVFLEANYDWVGGFTDNIGTGIRTDGLSVSVGTRF